jgi:hypothetical protein
MALLSHADTPERRQAYIAELREEERRAMRAYVLECKRHGTSSRLVPLAGAWRAAKRALDDAIDHDRNRRAAGGTSPTHCTICATPFDHRRPLKEVSPAGRGVCPNCARKLPVIRAAQRQERRIAA